MKSVSPEPCMSMVLPMDLPHGAADQLGPGCSLLREATR